MLAYCNGQYIEEKQASISIHDRGFLLGDGLFETIKSYHGHTPLLPHHWARLKKSAAFLNISLPLTYEQTQTIIRFLLQKNKLNNAGIRLTISRHACGRTILPTGQESTTVLITSFPLSSHRSWRLRIANLRRNEYSPLCALKSLHYMDNILARREAVHAGFDEALLLNTRQHIAETSVANIFFVEDERVITPPLSDGALPGITRQIILSLCEQQGIPWEEKSLYADEIFTMTEAFASNALLGIHAVSCIQASPITKSKIKTFTKHPIMYDLIKYYEQYVRDSL